MTAPTWGRVQRGVVWHVLIGSQLGGQVGVRSWCGAVDYREPVIEESDLHPPRGARTCRRCCVAVADFAHLVRSAQVGDVALVTSSRTVDPEPETYRGRPVEDVDLIGALVEQTADTDPGLVQR